jgi:hypothetical protein
MDPSKHLMLDISTVITFISDVINEPGIEDRFPDIEYKHTSNRRVRNEILDEKENPLMPKLNKVIGNKTLIICQMARDKVYSIVNEYGSEREMENYKKFMTTVKVIPDSPSERFMSLDPEKFSILQRTIFGTADNLGITLLTGYIKGVKLVNEIGYNVKTIPHRSRNIVGNRPYGVDLILKS